MQPLAIKNFRRRIKGMMCERFPSIREAARRGPLSEHCLRGMLSRGELPGVYSGKKFLVNYDRLLQQLNTEERQ